MTIFCLTIDFLLRHFKDHPDNLIVNNQQFTLLAYADYLVLFGSFKQDIESKINELVSIVNKIHLKFKPENHCIATGPETKHNVAICANLVLM